MMRFRQLLILIVLLLLALLTNAQSSPNYSATRTALAQQTMVRQGTRFFETPAEFQLTVTAQAIDASNTALALVTPIPTMEAQILPSEIAPTPIPVQAEPELFGDSVLPLALMFFVGVLITLGVLGGVFYMMNKREQGR